MLKLTNKCSRSRRKRWFYHVMLSSTLLWARSILSCTDKSAHRRWKISQPIQRTATTTTDCSTELCEVSWFRPAVLKVMVLEVSLSGAVNLKMSSIRHFLMQSLARYRWQTAARTRTRLNFSSQQCHVFGLTTSTQCLDA